MFEPDLLSRFTTHLKEALQKSLTFTLASGRDVVDPGDLLVGLLRERGSIASEVLSKAPVSVESAERVFRGTAIPRAPGSTVAPDLSAMVKRILEKAILIAHVHEHKYVGTEHLLLSLLETSLPDVHGFLEESGVNIDFAKEQLANVLRSTAKFPDFTDPKTSEQDGESPQPSVGPATSPTQQRQGREKRVRALEVFARELTSAEVAATLDPVIGRDQETDRVIEVLCRRTKNNPILLGEPGVGKTAIVEGLAQRLVAGDVPDALHNRRVYVVDLALMVAGTMYRGEFEARLKQLVEEAKQDQNTILFIDEIHTIVGAGSTSGSLDAANILKPALARGEIHCIGATTWSEYKKHIEPDAALERRYQPIDIPEPSAELTRHMLDGLRQRYEEHHDVSYVPEALEACVRLAERYMTDRFFPDKAIDLMDESAALVSSRRRSQEPMERLRALEVALHAVQEAKQDAITNKDLQAAAIAQEDEERLAKERVSLEQKMVASRKQEKLTVTLEHVARVVARLSHVSLEAILATERDRLRALEDRLGLAIVGQELAVKSVAEAVRKARLGLSDPRRPKASFLFVGPSGVGKTEMARTLASEIFGRADALLKVDMSEFAEGHAVSKLLGSPAGYVGYREGNRFADALRKRPHTVLLFDEFEKAHADVQHLLLQALEDGVITDATGRTVPFRHAYVVLTSNVGADAVTRSPLGFGHADQADGAYEASVRDQLKERFRPELLNRLDHVIVFRPLLDDTLKEIIRRELEVALRRMNEAQHVAYTAGDDVLDWLTAQGVGDLTEGARIARRLVEREILPLLGRTLLDKPSKKKGILKATKTGLKVA